MLSGVIGQQAVGVVDVVRIVAVRKDAKVGFAFFRCQVGRVCPVRDKQADWYFLLCYHLTVECISGVWKI